MYLSELCGRLNQILREHGDMKVVRHRNLRIDGIIRNNLNNFVDYSSENFGVISDYKQTEFPDGSYVERKVGEKFIIDIPL